MAEFWNLIVQSNTFNFAILVIIIAVVFAKIDLPGIIEKIKNDVARAIENAKQEKENAEKDLKTAQKTAANTDNEVAEQLKTAENNAQNLSQGIMKNTGLQIENIKSNILKVINAEEKSLSAKLTQDTVNNSIELAKQNIINKLNENPDLHNKFIDDSINEIDRVQL